MMQFSADEVLIILSGMHAILLSELDRSLEGLLHHTMLVVVNTPNIVA